VRPQPEADMLAHAVYYMSLPAGRYKKVNLRLFGKLCQFYDLYHPLD
jgi:hypothetical protein